MLTRFEEHQQKLQRLREAVPAHTLLRLRGIDWFAWLLAGASNGVLLAADKGVAEILVDASECVVLTDDIEARRLQEEELPEGVQVQSFPWAYPGLREEWIAQLQGGRNIASDHPEHGEGALTAEILAVKWVMSDAERQRYEQVGADASRAMTEVMEAAQPDWSELELAGAGAEALLARGLQPALILAAGERRLPLYRHPLPGKDALGKMAMLVFCARGKGLYANVTRFVSFGPLPEAYNKAHQHVRQIEAQALAQCQPGTQLASLYETLKLAYQQYGYPDAIHAHHQGGLTGYQAREIIARPDTRVALQSGHVLALNPSVPGAKIEDTFLLASDGLHDMTFDARWPHTRVENYLRPEVMQR